MKPILVVDRIEGNRVIVEFGEEHIEIPLEAFSARPKEGDRLSIKPQEADTSAQSAAQERLNRLQERDSGEDIIDL